MSTNKYDVVILGSGLSGTMLGAILAKQGLTVLLLDSEVHPRFAIGEATTPDTSCKLKLLALKYDVPEIANLATFYKLHNHVSAACGVKRSFSFLYQRENNTQNPKESHQFPTLPPPLGPDCHFFRQDTDSYMLSVALAHGADVQQKVRISNIDFEEERVILTSDKGMQFEGRYLVDSSGSRSVLAEKLGLRTDPCEMKTDSRTIFTHMIGVEHYDNVGESPDQYELKYPLSQGTLHHVFEGGWFWVIPFNNFRNSVNPLCSVGLLLNRALYPETGMDAEEEFYSYVNKFPQMKEQFKHAKVVRNWVTTGRIQYGAKNVVGHRYCLSAFAAGFIDPLFSSGINITASITDLLADRLISAFKTNDFSVKNFQIVDDYFQHAIGHFDEVVAGSFTAFQNYDLWDAWYRVWVAGNFVSTALNTTVYFKCINNKSKEPLKQLLKEPHFGPLGSNFKPHRELFDKALAEINEVRSGAKAPEVAAQNIRDLFKDVKYLPGYYRWHDKNVRTTPSFTFFQGWKLYLWYLLYAPKDIQRYMFGWHPIKVTLYVFRAIWENGSVSNLTKYAYIRDTFKAWNKDWMRR
jgi:tetracycline 7-halogenase / FADH2 O2-dependent halogenase